MLNFQKEIYNEYIMNYPSHTEAYIMSNYNINDERKTLSELEFIEKVNNAIELLNVDVVKFTFAGEFNYMKKLIDLKLMMKLLNV